MPINMKKILIDTIYFFIYINKMIIYDAMASVKVWKLFHFYDVSFVGANECCAGQ